MTIFSSIISDIECEYRVYGYRIFLKYEQGSRPALSYLQCFRIVAFYVAEIVSLLSLSSFTLFLMN